MAQFKPVYTYSVGSTPFSVTCTLASLAASSTVGRSCVAIDNTVNLFQDIEVFLSITTGAAALGGNKQVTVYAFGSDGNGNFEEEEGNAPGTDISYTINSPTIFRFAAILPVVNSSKVYSKAFTVARLFGGILPPKYGFIVCNDTGATFAASGFIFEYVGLNTTYA